MAKSVANTIEVSLIAFVNNRVDNKTTETNGQIFFQLICPYCPQKFTSTISNLRRHVQSVHEKKKYFCPVRDCRNEFSRSDKLKEHLGGHPLIT